MDLILAIIMLVLCYFIGKTVEKRHYKSIKQREMKLMKKPFITFSKNAFSTQNVKRAELVSASVVLGCDHFKSFIAGLKNIFGGNVSAYETVLDRGRREAILRIREKAKLMNADILVNVKIETVMLSPIYSAKLHPQVCITAYGTAIKYEQ